MEKNNKKRLLKIIEILRKKSDLKKHLKLDEIVTELEIMGIEVSNRKTLYDDFKILNENGFDIEYDNGYYLIDAPFNLSEIKIIQDSIYSLKNLDQRLLNNLNNKLYSFISLDDEKLLDRIKYTNKHKDKMLLQRMEDILEAIKTSTSIKIKNKNNEWDEIFPLFIYRTNDYYYFYYHYLNNKKIYHYRFDNINDLVLGNIKDTITISRKQIIDHIEASSDAYYSNDMISVNIILLNDDEYIIQRFMDDFPNALRTKNGFSIKVSLNNVFYSKLVKYGNDIKISDSSIANSYTNYGAVKLIVE